MKFLTRFFMFTFIFVVQAYAKDQSICASGTISQNVMEIATLTDIVHSSVANSKTAKDCKISGAPLGNVEQLHLSVDEVLVKLLMKEQCLNGG